MSKPAYTRLFEIIVAKQTAVCLSLDVPSFREGRHILEECAPYICMVKLHPDLFNDWCLNPAECAQALRDLAITYNFMIMYDAKLTDIPVISFKQVINPNILAHQWADFITIMPFNYVETRDTLASHPMTSEMTPVLVTEMNTVGGRIFFNSFAYQSTIKKILTERPTCIVNQATYSGDSPLAFTPGVVLDAETATHRSIENAIVRDGNHVVIIGRSIIDSPDRQQRIASACQQSWTAIKECLQ